MKKCLNILEKIGFYGGWFILLVPLVFIARDMFYCSESFDLLFLKDFDDMAFHQVLQEFRDRIEKGEWLSLFANVRMGYGNIYWLLMHGLTWIPDKMGWVQATILMPRCFSFLMYLVSLRYFYMISQCRRHSRLSSILALLLISLCASPIIVAPLFHNYTFSCALILMACYYLLKSKDSENSYLAFILFGFAIGVKLTALAAAPLFFLILNKNQKIKALDFIKLNLKASLVSLSVAIVSCCPAILFIPFGNTLFLDLSYNDFKGVLIDRYARLTPQPTTQSFMMETFTAYYYVKEIFMIGIGSAMLFLFLRRKKGVDANLIPLLTVLCLLSILLVAQLTLRWPYSFINYILPIMFIFTLIFSELATWRKWFLLPLALCIAWNVHLNKGRAIYFFETNAKQEQAEMALRYDFYKENIKTRPEEKIMIDFSLFFPMGLIKNSKNIGFNYSIDDGAGQFELFVFDKNLEKWSQPCEFYETRYDSKLPQCHEMKKIMNAEAPHNKIFEDDRIVVVRRGSLSGENVSQNSSGLGE